jgi:hypothetical protein
VRTTSLEPRTIISRNPDVIDGTTPPGELRREWFPARAFRTLAEAGAPSWAVQIFDRL